MWSCPCVLRYGDADEVPVWPLEVQAGLQSAACPALGRGGQEEGGGALLRQRDLLFARDLVCFARRRALRDAVLCSVTQPSAVSQFPCFVCPCLSLLSLCSLPWRRRSLPLLAFSCSFLAGRSQKTAGRTGTPTAYIRCAFFYLLLVALQAQQPKNFARFAPLCAPRAINSTPGGGVYRGGTPFVLTSARSKVRKGPSHAV